MTKLKFGADPEIFLFDTHRGKHISAHDWVPGTKKEPHKLQNGGAVQLDGVACEFNIEPAVTSKEFSDNIKSALNDIRKMLPSFLAYSFVPIVEFDKEYFDKVIPPDCKILGCDPDRDALKEGALNNPPPQVGTMRTAAGHVHIGWTEGANLEERCHFMDCVSLNQKLYNYFIPFKKRWDKDEKRQKMYGGNAAFRVKSYGTEFRTLSNAWVPYPDLHKWIFDSAHKCFEHLVDPNAFNRDKFDYGYYSPEYDVLFRTAIVPVAFPKDFANSQIKI